MEKLIIQAFFDKMTKTVSYVITDRATAYAAVIDPVLDYDPDLDAFSSKSADSIIDYLDQNNFHLQWILETHAHADHITASYYLKQKRGGQIGIGEHIREVQMTFKSLLNLSDDMPCDGRQFDYLFCDNELVDLGHLKIHVLHTPGHTPSCVSYLIEDAIFVGDTIFMPDFGTARTDFPKGNAAVLYQSIQKILSLPDKTRVFVGHDYQSQSRKQYAWETTVIEEKLNNIHMRNGVSQEQFCSFRESRDADLPVPALLGPSIKFNIQAGQVPFTDLLKDTHL